MENDVLYNRIMNVVHEEYGEGSTAVANPEGEATGDLEKIQIGDEIYGISGGGGGGGVFFVNATFDGENARITLDKTFREIYEASAVNAVLAKMPMNTPTYNATNYFTIGQTIYPIESGDEYEIKMFEIAGAQFFSFLTDNENGYPVADLS